MKKIYFLAILGLVFLANTTQAASLADRLRGYILLQVQSHGEAWYVLPDSGERVYMKNGEVAFGLMRDTGLGISNINLVKVPVGIDSIALPYDGDNDNDGLSNKTEESLGTDMNDADSDDDGYLDGEEIKNGYDPMGMGTLNYDYSLANRLKGRILLQVEDKGQAWYVNPSDGKRYYMNSGDAAYQIMRFLSLGITNADLNSISVQGEEQNYWQTYTNNQYNFSIEYPDDWTVADVDSIGPSLTVGFSPKDLTGDFQWGINIYNKNEKTVEELIADVGDQFLDRQESRQNIVIGGINAIKATITTDQYDNWNAEYIVFENGAYIFTISNGAIPDDNYEQFYNSLVFLD
ncbi:hypothetical protein KKH39_05320 [Patescibacteria group bacterium]|nr:hypothetical protein [Patescibacteria group bacterium]